MSIRFAIVYINQYRFKTDRSEGLFMNSYSVLNNIILFPPNYFL